MSKKEIAANDYELSISQYRTIEYNDDTDYEMSSDILDRIRERDIVFNNIIKDLV